MPAGDPALKAHDLRHNRRVEARCKRLKPPLPRGDSGNVALDIVGYWGGVLSLVWQRRANEYRNHHRWNQRMLQR